jgi:spore coat polysaccharide biosynthesis protein SpsF
MGRIAATAIIQARMGSSRLPGKVLIEIASQPMLVRVVERARLAKSVDTVVVATTREPADDPIADLCTLKGYPCYRGSEFDVLDRYYEAARMVAAQTIVRITADCPLIDPEVIDRTVRAFCGETGPADRLLSPCGSKPIDFLDWKPYDFAANRLPLPWGRTYPVGLDTEVCAFQSLETALREAQEKHQREHVMPFFYDHLERFRVLHVNHPQDFGSLRWTVDTQADLELVRRIYSHFPGRDDFSWLEVLELIKRHPELTRINALVQAKDYRQFDERLQ